MRRSYFLVIAILCTFLHVQAQDISNRKPICENCITKTYRFDLIFDSEGKLVSFPPAVLRQHEAVAFVVRQSSEELKAKHQAFIKALITLRDYLTADRSKILNDYRCIIGNEIVTYANELNKTINLLESKEKACDILELHKVLQEDNYFPVKSFYKKLSESQYILEIYNGETVKKKIDLGYKKCNEQCIEFTDNACYSIDDLITQTCTTCNWDQIQFRLTYNDPWNKTLEEWYNAKRSQINDDKIDLFKAGSDDILAGKNCKAALAQVNELGLWFQSWLWFTGGKLSLNPFPFDAAGTAIDDANKLITDKKESIRFLDSVKKYVKYKPEQREVFDKAQLDIDALNAEIAVQRKIIAQVNKTSGNTNKEIRKLYTSRVLYDGVLKLSKGNRVSVMKQFDAARSFGLIFKGNRNRDRVTEIPETETAWLLVHNVDSAAKLKLDQKRLDFDDQDEFTKQGLETFPKMDMSSIVSLIPKVQSLAGSFVSLLPNRPVSPAETRINIGAFNEIFMDLNTIGKIDVIPTLKTLTQPGCDCEKLKTYFADLKKTMDAKGSVYPPKEEYFKDLHSDDPMYRTVANPASLFEAPYRDSISIKEITKDTTRDVIKTYLKVGKVRVMQLAAGIIFNQVPTTTTSIDTSGNGFKVSSANRSATAVIGFKIYPFKNYNRDNYLIPRYPLRRLSAFAGFEITHPLDNFYLGAGYDLVPGVNLMAGVNMTQKTLNQVQNNQVIATRREYVNAGMYYGVTVNPALFIQFIKTLFK